MSASLARRSFSLMPQFICSNSRAKASSASSPAAPSASSLPNCSPSVPTDPPEVPRGRGPERGVAPCPPPHLLSGPYQACDAPRVGSVHDDYPQSQTTSCVELPASRTSSGNIAGQSTCSSSASLGLV